MIGRISYVSTTVAGAWGQAAISLGMGMCSREAFATVPPTVPDPNNEVEQPPRGWIYRDRVTVGQTAVGGESIYTIEFDIRAQRRLDEARIYIVHNNDPLQGTTFGVRANGIIRCLFKLP